MQRDKGCVFTRAQANVLALLERGIFSTRHQHALDTGLGQAGLDPWYDRLVADYLVSLTGWKAVLPCAGEPAQWSTAPPAVLIGTDWRIYVPPRTSRKPPFWIAYDPNAREPNRNWEQWREVWPALPVMRGPLVCFKHHAGILPEDLDVHWRGYCYDTFEAGLGK